ncbi:DUF6454 family protein [Amycolatopsis sp. NPDC051903]|uniref:DUF6454 family protein n=1 Tax=Amycolatopsis sp. NPDC051903 TaxID=3363936 RepID=UPI003799032D
MKKPRSRLVVAALSIAAVLGSLVTAHAAGADSGAANGSGARAATRGGVLANDFTAVDRTTAWNLTNTLDLKFPTYHPEGLAVVGDRMFLSSTQIIEPTKMYPTPQDGYDRTPGKGIGHLFVIDRQGKLLKDIVLGEGDMYHPGGIDFDGRNIWVPLAQYRPGSSAIMYRVDATTLQAHKEFEVHDHIGGIVYDRTTGHLVGNNWGSRRFYEWTAQGRTVATWDNPNHIVDFQDCQYVPDARMLCSGLTTFGQNPAAGGTSASYELGGLALIDLRSHDILHEIPFQKWSAAGHVVTRNPLKVAADGHHLTLWAAPDNGEDVKGTQVFTFEATV